MLFAAATLSKFSKVSPALNSLNEIPVEVTFENFYQLLRGCSLLRQPRP